MNQEELLKSLMELDFIAVDLGLFLNTHPDDSDAIAAYNQVITAADTVRMKYEETFLLPQLCRQYTGLAVDGKSMALAERCQFFSGRKGV